MTAPPSRPGMFCSEEYPPSPPPGFLPLALLFSCDFNSPRSIDRRLCAAQRIRSLTPRIDIACEFCAFPFVPTLQPTSHINGGAHSKGLPMPPMRCSFTQPRPSSTRLMLR